jgi:hypothetical protein
MVSTLRSLNHPSIRVGAFKLPHSNSFHKLYISSPEIRSFQATMSRRIQKNEISEETPVRCAGGVWTKEKYMTVNLSLIVGHIRNWKARFRGAMFVLEESRESVVSTGG